MQQNYNYKFKLTSFIARSMTRGFDKCHKRIKTNVKIQTSIFQGFLVFFFFTFSYEVIKKKFNFKSSKKVEKKSMRSSTMQHSIYEASQNMRLVGAMNIAISGVVPLGPGGGGGGGAPPKLF